MKCVNVRKYILTDYCDGELSTALKAAVDNHLLTCGSCQQLANEVLIRARAPFKDAGETHPPESIWKNIREMIINRRSRSRVGFSFFPFPGIALRVPKQAFAFATVLVLLIGTVSMIQLSRVAGIRKAGPRQANSPVRVNVFVMELVAFITSPENGGEVFDASDAELGTSIEEFLL